MPSLFTHRRVRHKRFDYEPRYYNPEREQKLKQRMRIKSKTHRGKPPRFIVLAVLLFFALYLLVKLGS